MTNPHLIWYAVHNGRIKSIFLQEDGSEEIKYGTGFVFAENWVITAATNIYKPSTDKFADSITYYPALGGDIENPPYTPVDVIDASIHSTVVSNTDPQLLYNIAFLRLDEKADKPNAYCGIRYQYEPYDGEDVLVVGYPNELPEDVNETEKGTYMYRGMGKVTSTTVFTYHNAATSDGYSGAPLYMNWGDGNGYVAIAMNSFENGSTSAAIKFNRLIFGAMKKIREEANGPIYCGGLDYHNIEHHQMELKNDGYYNCNICGYKVIAPELQDANILSQNDYLKVLATTIIYSFIISDETKNVLLYGLRETAHKIRSLTDYIGRYEYKNGEDICPIILPEQKYDKGNLLCRISDPIKITPMNIAEYNGIFNSIANFILGLLIKDPADALMMEISNVINELAQSGDITLSLYTVIKYMAGRAGNSAVSYILDLLQLGVDITEKDTNQDIVIGDTIVSYSTNRGNYGETFHVIFDENYKLKKLVYIN